MSNKKEQLTEKISAGYFDSNRQSPIFVGDVYKEEGAMIPYHKVIKDPEKGFMVEHVGTVEKFLLKDDAKNLIKKTYLGNIYETDWDELTRSKDQKQEESTTLNRHPQSEDDELPENTPEDVKDFLEGKTDELPEGTEVISEDEAKALEEKSDETPAGDSVENNTETDEKITENVENEQKQPENEQNTGENEQNPVNNEQTEANSEQKETKATPEVIANSKEEKNLLEKRNDYQRHIDSLKRKNDELETEAVKFENLASTLTFEPFVELKMIVSNAVQDYAKRQDIKECKKHLKNYEAIDSVEDLLQEYKELAEKNRSNIELNNKDIDNYEVKITEINDKLRNFQTKLFDTQSITNEPQTEETATAENTENQPEQDTTTEAKTESENPTQPESDVNSESENKDQENTTEKSDDSKAESETEEKKEDVKESENPDEDVPF